MIFLILILLPLFMFFCAVLVVDKIERKKKKQKSSTPTSPEWIAAMQELDELDYIVGIGPKPAHLAETKTPQPQCSDKARHIVEGLADKHFSIVSYGVFTTKFEHGRTVREIFDWFKGNGIFISISGSPQRFAMYSADLHGYVSSEFYKPRPGERLNIQKTDSTNVIFSTDPVDMIAIHCAHALGQSARLDPVSLETYKVKMYSSADISTKFAWEIGTEKGKKY